MPPDIPLPSSFRDPDALVFRRNGFLHRRIRKSGGAHYDHLMSSGLYDHLVADGLLIPHEEVDRTLSDPPDAYRTIRPEEIPFISYPYEWCFSQLKNAAETTLEIQKRAMRFDMTLIDASAYNVQFIGSRPVFIDTASFRKRNDGEPWTAYGQFCRHFLAPLALMSLRDIRLSRLLSVHLDGIPLDLASTLLPSKAWMKFTLLLHIRLHAASQKRYDGRRVAAEKKAVGRRALDGLIDSLQTAIQKLRWKPGGTEWADYRRDESYAPSGAESKAALVTEFLGEIGPRTVYDLGANVGDFSRMAAGLGAFTVAFDADPACVEINYLRASREKAEDVLPLLLDLTNPSPAAGWENDERMSLFERGSADAVLALALIHHLAIGNNIPLENAAKFFRRLGKHLIIEFVPKSDSQVARLLVTREDVFLGYTQESFEKAFETFFTINRRVAINDSERTLYWMAKK